MAETDKELKARDKAVEGVLREIYAAMADCIPVHGELDDVRLAPQGGKVTRSAPQR